jgi:FkbM family methyltransferase
VRFSPLDWTGRALRKAGAGILRSISVEGTWIDVGAHRGESSFDYACRNPGLQVYAFEPNLRAAASLLGRIAYYVVLPMAVAETDGCAAFHINRFDDASSLLPMNEQSRSSWVGGDVLRHEKTVTVPTIRLDTFMNLLSIRRVDFLKVDAQGTDLAVLKSAGSRLRDIASITIEVDVSPQPLYVGSASKSEAIAFLHEAGFELVRAQKQTYDQEENLTFERVE